MSSDPTIPIAIAFVSGKGGSGKTMIAAVATRILNGAGRPVVLVDGDVATGGLTYYLGLKRLRNTGRGMSTIAEAVLHETSSDIPIGRSNEAISALVRQALQPILDWPAAEFLGVGDHRRLYRLVEKSPSLFGRLAFLIINVLKLDTTKAVIVDCRGGIDSDSLDVCRAVEDIVLVVETGHNIDSGNPTSCGCAVRQRSSTQTTWLHHQQGLR